MPRPATVSIESIIEGVVTDVVARLTRAIERTVAERVAEEIRKRPAPAARGGRKRAPRRARAGEITRWVADRRARRVPLFVIELTGGLDTKKKIVAKYGENVVFEKGKPAPKPARAA
jgi:hypothetical protein